MAVETRIPEERIPNPGQELGATIGLEGTRYAGYRLTEQIGSWAVQQRIAAGVPSLDIPESWETVSTSHDTITSALDWLDGHVNGSAGE